MLAVGCSTNVGVQTRRDGAANFSQYRSWSWLPVEREDESPRSDVEHELAALVLEHIHREFSERGFIYRSDNVQRFCFFYKRAVDGINLRPLTLEYVLQHGRPKSAHFFVDVRSIGKTAI